MSFIKSSLNIEYTLDKISFLIFATLPVIMSLYRNLAQKLCLPNFDYRSVVVTSIAPKIGLIPWMIDFVSASAYERYANWYVTLDPHKTMPCTTAPVLQSLNIVLFFESPSV